MHIHRLQHLRVMALISTLHISVGKIDMGNTRLNFWDLGGQEELQSLWDKVSTEQTFNF